MVTLVESTENLDKEINTLRIELEKYGQKKIMLQTLIGNRKNIIREVMQYIGDRKNEINDKFIAFQLSRNDATDNEKELFQKIIQGVSITGNIYFYQDEFCTYLLQNCLDRRTIKSIEDVKAMIAGKNSAGQANDITIDSLHKWINEELDIFLNSDTFISNGKNKLINYIFTQWSEFLKVRTIVELNNVPIDRLSLGQRGTLLLKIYLAAASSKQIFIIDQPEDHLDNQFIMNELVPLIRLIKKSRQLILSTHNANLVVNTDAEQIIVARLDKEGDYICGSIENKYINKEIRDILEGGEEAFINREKKYQFDFSL